MNKGFTSGNKQNHDKVKKQLMIDYEHRLDNKQNIKNIVHKRYIQDSKPVEIKTHKIQKYQPKKFL